MQRGNGGCGCLTCLFMIIVFILSIVVGYLGVFNFLFGGIF